MKMTVTKWTHLIYHEVKIDLWSIIPLNIL